MNNNNFENTRREYNNSLNERDQLYKIDWKKYGYKKLKGHSRIFQNLIKNLNRQKREFLKEYLLNNTNISQQFFIASENIIQSTITDYLNPINEKISEKRDKRLFLFGILIGFILSALYQPIYDYYFSDKVNPPKVTEQTIDSISRKNNLIIIDTLKNELKNIKIETEQTIDNISRKNNLIIIDTLKNELKNIKIEIEQINKEISTKDKNNKPTKKVKGK